MRPLARALIFACLAASWGEASDGKEDQGLRVLLVSIGLHGHVVPLTRLAEALVARGHEVVLATHDVDDAPRWAADAGAKFWSLGPRVAAPANTRARSMRREAREP